MYSSAVSDSIFWKGDQNCKPILSTTSTKKGGKILANTAELRYRMLKSHPVLLNVTEQGPYRPKQLNWSSLASPGRGWTTIPTYPSGTANHSVAQCSLAVLIQKVRTFMPFLITTGSYHLVRLQLYRTGPADLAKHSAVSSLRAESRHLVRQFSFTKADLTS